ncbi:hemolysin family protein [Fulvivirgaceae bacterium PWU5]|uniref:Hemolysin family protein n=1 Tax=Dawidia cretensis TaxID=2782350 RepID=A0AAP2GTE4_9BACT|nr:hemolysin family protein [Dawidia cretensis]MBT1708148.1 hemolysin family protein [Dawidia cretensis]
MDIAQLLCIVLTILFGSFFAGIERAFLSANTLEVELEGRLGSPAARTMTFFLRYPLWLLATTRLGYILSVLTFGVLMGRFLLPIPETFEPTFYPVAMIIAAIVVTALLVMLAWETLPVILSSVSPKRVLLILAIPFVLAFVALLPVVSVAILLSRLWVIHVQKTAFPGDGRLFGSYDVSRYLKALAAGRREETSSHTRVLQDAMAFRHLKVRDCMIPRTEIIAMEIDSDVATLQQAFVESGHSRIIIYRGTIDDVVGYCPSNKLFAHVERIHDILLPMLTVPETTLANDLMIRFVREHKSLACVIDEFGGTSGIVSMEDIMNEVFGGREGDHSTDDEQRLDEHTFLLNGRLEIRYLNETYKLQLPTGNYDTLGGLILAHAAEFPRPGDVIAAGEFTFTVQSVRENRVGLVKVVKAIAGTAPESSGKAV